MVNDNSLQPLQSGDIVVVKDNYDEKACGLFENNGSIIIDDCEKKNGWLIGAIVGKFSKFRERRGDKGEDKDDTVYSEKANET
jgi:hypothetical protein